MARYVSDYDPSSGRHFTPGGADPNYRGRYRGMRMDAEGGQAAYGRYRWMRERDLGGSGGFAGEAYGGGGRGNRGGGRYDAQQRRPSVYDWEMRRDGGLRDPRTDRELIRGFNANSPALQPGTRWRYEGDYPAMGRHPVEDGRPRTSYPNRGLSSGGYAEAWQHRPGHGSR
jgi:hypothetical protein